MTDATSTMEWAQPQPATLRQALGRFTTGVTIVTVRRSDGGCAGLTVNSFNALSLSPPLVLWSLGVNSSSMADFLAGGHHAIHILAADQMALAQRFATRGIDRFEGLSWRAGLHGAPLLPGALVTLECAHVRHHLEGDHRLFINEVLAIHPGRQPEAQPLLFAQGQLRAGLGVLPDVNPKPSP